MGRKSFGPFHFEARPTKGRAAINASYARRVPWVPKIITDARTGHLWGNGGRVGGLIRPPFDRTHGPGVHYSKHSHTIVDPDFMRSYVVRNLCAKLESIGERNGRLRLRARQH